MTFDSDLMNLLTDLECDMQAIIDEMKERPDYDPVVAENHVLEVLKGLDFWPDDDVDPNEDTERNVNENNTLPQPANARRGVAVRQGCKEF